MPLGPFALNRYPEVLPFTPLVPVRLSGAGPEIWCKLEFLNPSGSTKDRIARHILGKAFREGRVKPGDAVVEASSGSTSIAMALVCAQLGLRFTAVLPEGASSERALMIRAYGGEIRFAPREGGIQGCIEAAEALARDAGAFPPRQFSNPDNAAAHETTTAREILEQIPGGAADAVVSGVGTGGTLVGLARGCAASGRAPRLYLARPVDLGVRRDLECCSFSCKIPGVIDCASALFRESDHPGLRVIEVPDGEALETTRALIRLGFPVGPSSGLNFHAAAAAARELGDARVVTVIPDRMERYFTTELFRPIAESIGPKG